MAGVVFTADGAQHELRLSTRACRQIERDAGMSMPKFIQSMSGTRDKDGNVSDGDLSFESLHMVFKHGLRGGKGAATEDEVDDIIDALGGMVPAAQLLGDAIAAAFPSQEKADEAEGGTVAGNGAKRSQPKAA